LAVLIRKIRAFLGSSEYEGQGIGKKKYARNAKLLSAKAWFALFAKTSGTNNGKAKGSRKNNFTLKCKFILCGP
jgi:hypothetical protein